MDIALIAAVAENGVIGCDNRLPWHLPEDLRYFKRVTMGKPVIMGRKTFASIGKALPGRTNIVMSSRHDLPLPEGVQRAASVADALALAKVASANNGATEAMVIGGEQVYRLFLPLAGRLYLTRVHREVAGDAWFPAYEESEWELRECERFETAGEERLAYSFCLLERKISRP